MLENILGKIKGKKKQESTLKEEEIIKKLNPQKLPKHIAIIMDGNGRWALKRGIPRGAGHRAGVESLRQAVNACANVGIKYLTVYAFSTENWKRPKEEINILMDLLVEYINKEIKVLHEKNIRVNSIGRTDELPLSAQKALAEAEELTKKNTTLTLNLALNYGGRSEIVDAVKKISQKVLDSEMKVENIDEKIFSENLYTAEFPDPDLVIRPSGEYRLSNYLLWQIAYSELWVTPVFWPDFRKVHLLEAILSFQSRKRRFGGLKY